MKGLLFLLAGCLIQVQAFGSSTTEWGLQTQFEAAQSLSGEGSQKQEITLQPEIKINTDSDSSWYGLLRIRYDDRYPLYNGDAWQEGYGDLSKSYLWGDSGEVELRELYYSTYLSDSYLRLGKQQIVWGKADGLKLFDIVNPQSYREFILDDYEDSRIPLWSVNLEFPFDNNTLQILWILDPTVHEPAISGSAFTFTSQRFVPQAPAGVRVVQHAASYPSMSPKDSDFGLRWTGFQSGWDYTLNYLYQYNDTPLIATRLEITQSGPLVHVEPRYERSHVLGTTASKAFGDLTFRLEGAYSTNRFFISDDHTDSDGLEQGKELAYVLGFDWYGFRDTLLSFQLFESHLLAMTGPATRPKHDRTMTFLSRKYYLNDLLELRLSWFVNHNDKDGLVRFKATYDWTDSVKIWAGIDLFYGNEEGIFGEFDENDRIFFSIQKQI